MGTLAFFANGRLSRLDVASGSLRVLADAPEARGGSWSSRDVVISSAASANGSRALFTVPAGGGAVRQITNRDDNADAGDSWPTFLPDDEHFTFTDSGAQRNIVIGSLPSIERIPLFGAVSPTAFTPGALWRAWIERLRGTGTIGSGGRSKLWLRDIPIVTDGGRRELHYCIRGKGHRSDPGHDRRAVEGA